MRSRRSEVRSQKSEVGSTEARGKKKIVRQYKPGKEADEIVLPDGTRQEMQMEAKDFSAHANEDEKNYKKIIEDALAGIKKKKRSSMPVDLLPMLANAVEKPFDDPDWIYEIKWDGYRSLAYRDERKAELRSRNNNSFNEKFYPVHEALKQWPVKAVVDGEILVVNEEGRSLFHKLESWKTAEDGELVYYVFDLLWLNGYNLMELPLVERRELLQKLVPEESLIRFSESFAVKGTDFFASAEKLGIEGIVAKKADSIYVPGSRTSNWLKIKTEKRHEVVIAGYTINEGSDKKFSALIVGVYNEDEKLKFLGQIGTGFTREVQNELIKKLKPLETKECPFEEVPVINKPTRFRPNPPKAKVKWVKAVLVCEVSYQELKPGGIMRHARFRGLRTDKPAKDVRME